MSALPFIVTAVLGYLLGSIPFGFLLVRLIRGEDVRSSGSGNIGATNVARKSPLLGVATLVLDVVKGFVAVFIPWLAFGGPHRHLIMATGALFAVLGHMFTVWLKFRGGKGVATSLGAFALLTPKTILCLAALFIVLVLAFRYVSLGSISAAAAFPLVTWALREYHEPLEVVIIGVVSALVIWKHRANILRLAAGREMKLGEKTGAEGG